MLIMDSFNVQIQFGESERQTESTDCVGLSVASDGDSMHGEFLREPRAEVLSAGVARLRRSQQDTRRLPVQVTAPVLADTLPDVRPVAAPSDPAAGGDAVGVIRPAAVIGRGELEGSGLQSPGDRQAPEPAPRRLPATVAVGRRPLSVRVRALAGGAVLARAGRAWRAVAVPLLLLTMLAATPAHSQNSGICARTDAVETAILAAISGVSACGDVTTTHLAAISGTLNLGNSSITTLAAGDFAGLTSLTALGLHNNQLATLPLGVFAGLTAVTVLNLENNQLATLPAGVFTELTALVELNMPQNELVTLRAGVFGGLTALKKLWLNNNKLTNIHAGVFGEPTGLEILVLNSNLLVTLSASVFDGLTGLKSLALHDNALATLHAGVFDGLIALEKLWLNDITLTMLPAGVFDDLTALTQLFLHDNALTNLPAEVFDGLTMLELLWLNDNALTMLPAGVFDDLTALTQLYLNDNALTMLPAEVFDDLTMLDVLWLYGNKLATLPAAVFERLTSLTALQLADNPGAPFDPGAVALPDDGKVLNAGGTVTLDGSGSGGPWGANVTYSWALTKPANGVIVTFDDAMIATPVATIPALTDGTELTFTLTVTGHAETGVSSSGIASGTDTATVTVDPTTGICGRTAAVQTAILAKISDVDDCDKVNATHLAAITGLLNLISKSITTLAAGDFAGLTSLEMLELRNNSLTTLPVGVFAGLTSLTELILYDNRLTALPAGVFAELSVLTQLGLTGNDLTTLSPGVFAGLTSLTGLDLSGNGLTELPAGVFDGLTSLTTLVLHNNGLTTLPAGVFAELLELDQLELHNNLLGTLPAGVFAGLPKLTVLFLHNNGLTTLPAGVFAGLTALDQLELHNNLLGTLPDDVLQPLTSLTTLSLLDNPGAPFAPVAVALPDGGTVSSAGGTVMLDGRDSDGGPWGTNVLYSWALTDPASGVDVRFDDPMSAKPVVTIPPLPEETSLTFTLTVNGRGTTGPYSTGVAPGTDTAMAAPPSLSVQDASVQEPTAPGTPSPLVFEVVLEPAFTEDVTVTVRYETRDGTAQAGDDYTLTSGMLTFAPGEEKRKKVNVPVLADSHYEGSETMTLVLSNAVGAVIVDAEGTGTIREVELTPKAWIARFGRTVAEQALEAIEGRMRATLRPGVEVALAGERIGGSSEPGSEGERDAWREEEARGDALRLADWLRGKTDPEEAQRQSRAMTHRGLLTGSAFALTAETAGEDLVSLWGRGAVTRFDGREGELTLDGEVVTGMLGTDWTGARWTAGLIVSRSVGEGGYRDGSGSGTGGKVEATLTSLFPWVRRALSERLEAWGAVGYGAGELTVRPGTDEDSAASRADLDLRMASAGLRGTMLDGGGDGLTLSGKTDAMVVQTTSERGRGAYGVNLVPAQATVTRLRLGLEASRTIGFGGGAALTPSLEVGVRHDGGDAETGFGFDLGGGLALSNPERGLKVELRGRGLLAHESEGFRDLGFSGSLAWEERPSSDRGAQLTISQTVGGSSSGGADALLARGTLEGLAANDNRDNDDLGRRRLELELGYGLSAFDDRFTWTPEAGFGLSDTGRDYGLGWRLVRGGAGTGPDDGSLELSFEARRRESAHEDTPPAHEVGLRLRAQF